MLFNPLFNSLVVYHQCQCSLFKQFTTVSQHSGHSGGLFIINVNVLFLSNSQQVEDGSASVFSCLSSMSMFSF